MSLQQAAVQQLHVKLYAPHAGQLAFHQSTARFRVLSCGRRFGKTLACCNEMARFVCEHNEVLAWWVAPTYAQTMIAWRTLTKALRPLIAEERKSELRLLLMNGSVIQFKSANKGDNLRGEGVHFLVIDEAAMIDPITYEQALRPTLSDTRGFAVLASTPKGRNYFYHLFLRGQDPEYPQWESFTLPTSANPYIDAEEIEEAERTLPQAVFQQEYLALFLDDATSVFRNVQACLRGDFETPQAGHQYILGWDVAKKSDYSVVFVFDVQERRVVLMDRFNLINYTAQIARVKKLAELYNTDGMEATAPVLMDSTGVGDAVLDAALEAGLSATGFIFSGQSKQQAIEYLVVQFEQQKFSVPNIPIMLHEINIYEQVVGRAGTIKYGAPSGFHDDCVSALALTLWHARMYLARDLPIAVSSRTVVYEQQQYQNSPILLAPPEDYDSGDLAKHEHVQSILNRIQTLTGVPLL
jgi:hypothetical protein